MNEGDAEVVAGLLLLGLGALQLFGIFALLPQCGFGVNFIIGSWCISPITVFGLNPNLVAGAMIMAFGFALVALGNYRSETE